MPAQSANSLLVQRQGDILIVTLNRPDKMNALNNAMQWELHRVFDEFQHDDTLRVAILTGAGDRAFCAGSDIAENARISAEGRKISYPPSGYGGLAQRYDCYKPIIAAVNGLALGGGFELALACDLIVATDHATFGLPEPKIGVAAIGGGMIRLPMQIGLKPAMQILLTAKPVSAQRAFDLGLINEIAPADRLMDQSMAMARDIAANAPLSVMATKQVAMQGLQNPDIRRCFDNQHGDGFSMLEAMRNSRDIKEGAQAFVEKRKPQWRGE